MMDAQNDLIVTNFSELGTYIKSKISHDYETTKKTWKRRFRRCQCGKANEVFAESDSETEKKDITTNDLLLKPNLIQSTTLYIQKRKRFRKDIFIDEALIYYLDLLLKSNGDDEKVNLKFVKELRSEGVDVNFINEQKENALFMAVKLENEDLVKYLLEEKVNIRQINDSGCSIFHMTASNKNANILRMIAEQFTEDELEKFIDRRTNVEKQTPLHFAVKEGSTSVVESLIMEFNVNKEVLDYKHRTPLFLAAEYNRKSMVKLLMSLKCLVSFTDKSKKETLNNCKGQTALYWIVTKMPDIAREALDQLYEPNPYLRKDKHYLAPLEPKAVKREDKTDVLPKSVLAAIVESGNLDLIMHPTILCLINLKWQFFGRTRAWLDFFLTIIYVTVWITFGMWVPYNQRYSYDFTTDNDRFRLSLFIIGILITIWLIISEIKEVYNDFKYQKKANRLRKKELDEYQNTHENSTQSNFVKDEEALIKQNNIFSVLRNYFSDIWNLYDWFLIILLLVCIGTHIDDIIQHTEYKSRVHIRIMAVTIIFICIRLLKSARVIIPKFGTLVMILYYAIADMVIWFVLYVVIWLSFSCAFWMIYGGIKFEKTSNEDGVCKDVYAKDFNDAQNCTTVSIAQFARYDLTAYFLYRLTFGNALNEDLMNDIDDQLTNPLIGSYIGLTALVLVNIFIALLSTTFNRVFEKAEAYIVFQRAMEILSKEKSMSYGEKKDHIQYLRKIGCPYIDNSYHEIISTTDDRISNLEEEIKEQKKILKTMENNLDQAYNLLKYQSKHSSRYEKKLQDEIVQLKDILMNFLDVNSALTTDRSYNPESKRPPQFDYLKYNDFATPSGVVVIEPNDK